MARITSPRPSSSSSTSSSSSSGSAKSAAGSSPRKHIIRISAEKMRWYRAQEAAAAAAAQSRSPFARRVRINLKRRESS